MTRENVDNFNMAVTIKTNMNSKKPRYVRFFFSSDSKRISGRAFVDEKRITTNNINAKMIKWFQTRYIYVYMI